MKSGNLNFLEPFGSLQACNRTVLPCPFTILENQYTFLITSRSVLLRMRNVSGKSCRENQNTHFGSVTPPPPNRAVFEIMRENILEPDRTLITIRCMRIACWIPKATDTHSEYVILFFSTTTMAARTYLNITPYVHSQSR
jgi:hypothetical protein